MHPDDNVGWTQERVRGAADLYRKFLVLNGMYPEQAIVPTPDIDAVWHAHMQDTAKYRLDCDYVFGAFLDHFPYVGLRGNDDARYLQSSFAKTRVLFAEVFGHDLCETAVDSSEEASSCVGNGCSNGSSSDIRPVVDFQL